MDSEIEMIDKYFGGFIFQEYGVLLLDAKFIKVPEKTLFWRCEHSSFELKKYRNKEYLIEVSIGYSEENNLFVYCDFGRIERRTAEETGKSIKKFLERCEK